MAWTIIRWDSVENVRWDGMGPKIAAGSGIREAHVGSRRKWCLAIIRERKELITTSLILNKTLTLK